jgi:tRNA(Leu) C34 or U34 (ribose-2'-O)-methylase TrmL
MHPDLANTGAAAVASKPVPLKARGFAAIGLFMPKSDVNVGGACRAADCYGASMVVVQGHRYWSMATDTTKMHRHIPLINTSGDVFDHMPYDCVPVGIELCDNAESLVTFKHPERAFYIFGPEDGSLGKRVLDRCKHRVMVPTNTCMNLAATVNVVLYDRLAKQHVKRIG